MDHSDIFNESTKNQDGITGVRVGVVTDNKDPKNLGRVKLRFPWRNANDESYWARIATMMSGRQYGSYFLPEVDDEVLVAFAGGDVHQPFVVGALWNGKQKPPEKNKDGNNDIREIVSRQGHTIQFDDNKLEGGHVEIKTKKGHTISLTDKNGAEKIAIKDKSGKNNITLDTGSGAISLDADSKIDLSADDITIDAKNNVDISAQKSLDLTGKGKAKLSSNGKLDISSTAMMQIKAGATLNISGMMIFLN